MMQQYQQQQPQQQREQQQQIYKNSSNYTINSKNKSDNNTNNTKNNNDDNSDSNYNKNDNKNNYTIGRNLEYLDDYPSDRSCEESECDSSRSGNTVPLKQLKYTRFLLANTRFNAFLEYLQI